MVTEIDNLLAALNAIPRNGAAVQKATDRLLAAAQQAPLEDRNIAVQRLAPLISLDDPKRSGLAAAICGALVENGADPSSMGEPLLARLLPALRDTPNAHHEETIQALAPPAIALFSAKPALRAAHPEVRDLAESWSNRVEWCGWLQSLFDVLEDEPLLVIEPASRIGILARLSGVDVNFTLNMLLMHRFPGPGGVPHSRLSKKAASVLEGGPQQSRECVNGVWNLYNWQALDDRCSLPTGQSATEHWIWNEGTPADIAIFEGRRVILLGPAAYLRGWPAQRTFAAMKPELRIEKILTPEEVQGWLEKMRERRN